MTLIRRNGLDADLRTCSVEDCNRPPKARGLCKKHWSRWRKTGTTELAPYPPLAERFWARVDRRSDDECWLWMAARTGGYGVLAKIGEPGQYYRAHRLSWELHNGQPIPEGYVVRHSCDNPPCVNPGHLDIGTHADNMRDMRDRGRARGPRRVDGRCLRGHVIAEVGVTPSRSCRRCRADDEREKYAARRRAEAAR